MDETTLDTREAAALLGLKPNTLTHWRAIPIRDPGLPCVKFNNRSVRYRRQDLLDSFEKSLVARRKEEWS